MPVNKQKIWTYSDSDVVQSWPAFMNLGFNSVSEVVKGLQDGRVIFANNSQTMSSKLAAIKETATQAVDTLVYRVDEGVLYMHSNDRLTKIFGGAVETDFVNNNASYTTFRRYNTGGSNNPISQTLNLPKAGVWLVSAHMTIANDDNAANAYIDVFMGVDSVEKNMGTYNTYTNNGNIMFVGMGPVAKYVSAPKNVQVSVRVACNPASNIGWGGLTVQATKIG